jgi:hypothetical protein
MFGSKGILIILGAPLLCVAAGFPPQAPPTGIAVPRSIQLNVVVKTASGQWVTDLQPRDFTIFDNNSARPITSFKAGMMGPKAEGVTPPPRFASRPSNAGGYERGEHFVYEITFDAACAKRANEYHSIAVKVDKPNLIIRSRNGYYAHSDNICAA